MAARATLEATRSACRHGSRCSVVEESGTCGNGTGRMKNCTEPRGRAIQGRDVTVWTGTKAVGQPRVKHAPKPDLMQARNPNLDFFLILALSRFAASSSPKDRSRSDLGPDSGLDTVGPEHPGRNTPSDSRDRWPRHSVVHGAKRSEPSLRRRSNRQKRHCADP